MEHPKKNLRFAAKNSLAHLNTLEQIRHEYAQEITKQLKSFPESKYLKSIPGIKNIQAAKIIAQVIEPRRFENKHQFYSYCGLVKHQQISAGHRYGTKRAWGNRMLKCVYKMAAQSAVRGNSTLRTYYDSLRAKGTSDKNARNAVARKVAAISLSLWRNHKKYDGIVVVADRASHCFYKIRSAIDMLQGHLAHNKITTIMRVLFGIVIGYELHFIGIRSGIRVIPIGRVKADAEIRANFTEHRQKFTLSTTNFDDFFVMQVVALD